MLNSIKNFIIENDINAIDILGFVLVFGGFLGGMFLL